MGVWLRMFRFGLLALLGSFLFGCSTAEQAADTQLAQACISEVGVKGGYKYEHKTIGRHTVIRVPASAGVTQAQSDAINACIQGNETATGSGGRNYSSAPAGFPTTAQACYDSYRKQVTFDRSTAVSAGGGSLAGALIGAAIGRGIVKGVASRRYRECLVRVGASPAEVAVVSETRTRTSPRRRSRAVMSGGAGYRISGAPVRATTRVAPTTTRTVARRGKSRNGKLALPTQYPLMQGDAALWSTLTLEQQKRAILFLQSGSSIQSSLLGD